MKVLWRPQRGGLDEAMEEMQEFNSIKEMLEFVAKDNDCDVDDVYLSYYGYDERIDWETYIITIGTQEILKEYSCPQADSFCTIKE